MSGKALTIYRRLMTAIDRCDLADDPALARNDGRVVQNTKLDDAIGAWTAKHSRAKVLEILEAAEVPCGRVYSAADIYNDAHYRAREMIEAATLPDGAPIELPGIVPKLSATPGQTRWLGPALGEHTREVLASVGIVDENYKRLHAEGVI